MKTKINRSVLSSMLGKYAALPLLHCRSYFASVASVDCHIKGKGCRYSTLIPVPTLFYGIESDDGDANNEKEEEERWFS